MNRPYSIKPITWELRELSMMADKACIGLGLFMRHQETQSDIKQDKYAELLLAGIRFCDAVLAGLDDEQTEKDEYSRLSRKIAVLIDEARRDPTDLADSRSFLGQLNNLQTIHHLEHIRIVLTDVVSGASTYPNKDLLEVQDKLHDTSLLFYKADIASLRQAENILSLRT